MKKLDEISDPMELMKYSELLFEEERYEEALKAFKEAIRYQINDRDITWKIVSELCNILGDEEELLQKATEYLMEQ